MTKTIALSQGRVTLVDDQDLGWLSQWKWSALKSRATWYAIRHDYSAKPPKYIYMHRQILNSQPRQRTHHINGDGLDNRRANIITLTRSEHQKLHPSRPWRRIWSNPSKADDAERNFGKGIQILRIGQRMRQEDLADLVGLQTRDISAIELGKRLPNLDLQICLCQALGWEPYDDATIEQMGVRQPQEQESA